MSNERKLLPAGRMILIAALAGGVAGAVAVYATTRFSGNNGAEPPVTASSPAATDADRLCEAKSDRAKAVADAAQGHVAAMLAADPPQSMAALAFNDPTPKPMTLADRKGKVTLVNLWATWCAPCRAEMPALDALQKERGSDGFEVVAINVDTGDDTKPKKFLADIGIASLGYYRDNTLGVFNDLKRRGLALGLPVTLLVDEDGCLLAHMNGPAEWNGPDGRRLIDAALAGAP